MGLWREAYLFGNPVPAIYGLSEVGVVEVTTADNSPFLFTSVDLADAGSNAPFASYRIDGLLGASTVFTTGVSGPLTGQFATIEF